MGIAAASEACHHVNKLRMLLVVRMAADLQYQALTEHSLQTRRAQMNQFDTGIGVQFHRQHTAVVTVLNGQTRNAEHAESTAISVKFDGEALGETPGR